MKRREFIALIGMSAAWPAVAQSQQWPTLGLLSSSEMADYAIKPFRAALAEGGFVEGRNLTVIYRSAEGQFDRLPALAEELANRQVSVIFATGSPVPARSAKAATTTIPIVFAYGGDPVRDGLVASFNRPEGMSPAQPSSGRHSRQSGWACCVRFSLKFPMLRCL
ncbi:MAG: ABC transporter substrate binding protein [Bradyrhizobium sp.]